MFAIFEMGTGWDVRQRVFYFLTPQIKMTPVVSFKSEKDTCTSIVCKDVLLAGQECKVF